MMSMKNIYQQSFNRGVTAPIVGREKDMKLNHTGGYVFQLPSQESFERYVLIGISGTFYQADKEQFAEMTPVVIDYVSNHTSAALDFICDTLVNRRAITVSPALFLHAFISKKSPDEAMRRKAYSMVPKIIGIPTHLFEWLEYCQGFGGWSAGLRRAVNNWYAGKSLDNFAYQTLKYRQRNGWEHRDVWNLSHLFAFIKRHTPELIPLAQFVYGGYNLEAIPEDAPAIVRGYEKVVQAQSAKDAAKIIEEYRLVREFVPTEFLNSPEVWKALLPSMPAVALIRNLSSMSRAKLFTKFSGQDDTINMTIDKIGEVHKAKVHPYTLLKAMRTYGSGAGMRSTWDVNPNITDALDKALESSFDAVEPTGKNFLVAADCSGSMTGGWGFSGSDGIAPYEVATVLGLVAVKSEPNSHMVMYDNELHEPRITAKDSFQSAARKAKDTCRGGSTRPSVVMDYVNQQGMKDVDVFVFITDNEVNGGQHAYEMFLDYKRRNNKPNAKFIVIGLTVTNFTMGDPSDPNVLNVAGFSPQVPELISRFVA